MCAVLVTVLISIPDNPPGKSGLYNTPPFSVLAISRVS